MIESTNPSPATTFAHLDATLVLSRGIAKQGIYPRHIPLITQRKPGSVRVVDEGALADRTEPMPSGNSSSRVMRRRQLIRPSMKSLSTSSRERNQARRIRMHETPWHSLYDDLQDGEVKES